MNKYRYSQSFHHYFWQWEEYATVLSIPGGNTIAYRSYVEEVLAAISPQGIPLFGTLLLAILATNQNGRESVDQVKGIIDQHLKKLDIKTSYDIDVLYILSGMPPEYKTGKKRILLFKALFENCHNRISVKRSKAILKELGEEQPAPDALPDYQWNKDIYPLSLLSHEFTGIQSVIDKIALLPPIEEPLQLDDTNTVPEDSKTLVDSLIDSPKTFYAGALVRSIWAGLNIPFHNILPSRQPLGGISDLTNKGDLDRLLISEFANDDLFFLSRLANNEALYINREIPPENNNKERVILIDTSIRNWGTPHTIAFAVMIAIACHPKTDIPCLAFTVDTSYQPVDYGNISSVIDGLQQLDGCLNAASGLKKFFTEQKNTDKEIIFISTNDATRYPEVQRVLSDYASSIKYHINTTIDGTISLYKRQHNSKRHIQDIRLNLGDLWKRKAKESQNTRTRSFDHPLLVPANPKTPCIFLSLEGELFMRDSNRLLRSRPTSQATHWEVISELINGSMVEAGQAGNGACFCLSFARQRSQSNITITNLATDQAKSLVLDADGQFLFYQDKFFVRQSSLWTRYISLDGRVVECPDMHSHIQMLYSQREKEKEEIVKKNCLYGNPAVLRKINRIAINRDSRLIINTHELKTNRDHYKWKQLNGLNQQGQYWIESITEDREIFSFPGGSTVRVSRSGMLRLESSNADIPVIYIPTTLDSALGFAAGDEFAGNELYYKDKTADLILTGDHIPETVSDIIRSTLDITPFQTRIIMEAKKVKHFNLSELYHLKSKLDTVPSVIENITPGLIKTDVTSFYKKYIQAFIDHIRYEA